MGVVLEKGKSVLIADDDPMNRMVLRAAIQKRGHRVVDAADGHQLMALVRSSAFDLCIMDASMPGPSLEDRLTILMGLAPATKVLVLSGYAREPVAVKEANAFFLTKPIDLAILNEVLEGVEGKSQDAAEV